MWFLDGIAAFFRGIRDWFWWLQSFAGYVPLIGNWLADGFGTIGNYFDIIAGYTDTLSWYFSRLWDEVLYSLRPWFDWARGWIDYLKSRVDALYAEITSWVWSWIDYLRMGLDVLRVEASSWVENLRADLGWRLSSIEARLAIDLDILVLSDRVLTWIEGRAEGLSERLRKIAERVLIALW